MVLSSPSNRLFDPVRKQWVAATAEERVRQALIQLLLNRGVPPHHLLVEVRLDRLPGGPLPSCRAARRCDLLLARFVQGQFQPYLLAECKAHEAKPLDLEQLLAYQSQIQSRWLVLATPGSLWVYEPARPGAAWSHELPDF